MSNKSFDIIVIGGGHAGLEAAHMASQFQLSVAIFTLPGVGVASAPCNPAIGGVGKGQVVREMDVLGGIMPYLADRAGIQYRILNESKGYAVQSTRAQIDKDRYSFFAEEEVQKNPYITLCYFEVRRVEKIEDDVFKLETADGQNYLAKKVIVTTGTFLAGKLHTGKEQDLGGRRRSPASVSLNCLFSKIKALPVRFKTGTPPRLDAKTISFSPLIKQKSDDRAENFSSLTEKGVFGRNLPQVSCYLTHTNEETLRIIRDNKENSPIFNGQIKGVGPRYCPSIEDKAFRYLDRNSHHVFLEPEGLNTDSVYPNGVSTSLPKEIQLEFLRTISGLEKVDILEFGHAVEYDVVDTTSLNSQLESRDVPGVFFAGQVNGTSGYEEAGAQGLIAGANAALSLLGKEPLIISREDSYIGVMIDDLVTSRRDEPYRLFTARSENRLYIREDNTILRMKKYRDCLGLNLRIDQYLERFMKEFDLLMKVVKETQYKVSEENSRCFDEKNYGALTSQTTLVELLKRSHLDPVKTLRDECLSFGVIFSYKAIKAVAITLKYEGYIQRALVEESKFERLARLRVDWEKIVSSKNISTECKQRISKIRPETFFQLQRIEGIRPATLAYVAANLI